MKSIVTVLALLLAGISALPQDSDVLNGAQERLITNNIERAIQQLIETIQERGLDPWHKDWSAEIHTPIGGGKAWIKDAEFKGLSNIKTPRLSWGVIARRLTITLLLPEVTFSAKSIGMKVSIMGREFSVKYSGTVKFINIQVHGDFRFIITPIGGARLSSCGVEPSGRVESNATLSIGNHVIGLDGWARHVTQWLHDNGDLVGDKICALAAELM